VTGCRPSLTEPPAFEARRPNRIKRPELAVGICSPRAALRSALPPRRSFSGTLLEENGTRRRAWGCIVRYRREEKMTIAVTRNFLLWCTVINYGVLLVWFLVFVFAHDWMLRIYGRWFRLSRDQFDALHYAGMSIFKIGIIPFNLVPFIVLSILA
jgi:hypothetical protein